MLTYSQQLSLLKYLPGDNLQFISYLCCVVPENIHTVPLPWLTFGLIPPFPHPPHPRSQPCQKFHFSLRNVQLLSPKNYQPNSLSCIWNFSLCCWCNSVIIAGNQPVIIQESPLSFHLNYIYLWAFLHMCLERMFNLEHVCSWVYTTSGEQCPWQQQFHLFLLVTFHHHRTHLPEVKKKIFIVVTKLYCMFLYL